MLAVFQSVDGQSCNEYIIHGGDKDAQSLLRPYKLCPPTRCVIDPSNLLSPVVALRQLHWTTGSQFYISQSTSTLTCSIRNLILHKYRQT